MNPSLGEFARDNAVPVLAALQEKNGLNTDNDMTPTLTNPFENTDDGTVATDYQAAVARGEELQALPRSAATDRNILRQHSKIE